MHRFRNLDVWKRAVALADLTYDLTEGFPPDERFGLRSQMRRAAVSISSNISEGAGDGGPREFPRFLRMAYRSACELETQAVIAANRSFMSDVEARSLLAELDELRRILSALRKRAAGS